MDKIKKEICDTCKGKSVINEYDVYYYDPKIQGTNRGTVSIHCPDCNGTGQELVYY